MFVFLIFVLYYYYQNGGYNVFLKERTAETEISVHTIIPNMLAPLKRTSLVIVRLKHSNMIYFNRNNIWTSGHQMRVKGYIFLFFYHCSEILAPPPLTCCNFWILPMYEKMSHIYFIGLCIILELFNKNNFAQKWQVVWFVNLTVCHITGEMVKKYH